MISKEDIGKRGLFKHNLMEFEAIILEVSPSGKWTKFRFVNSGSTSWYETVDVMPIEWLSDRILAELSPPVNPPSLREMLKRCDVCKFNDEQLQHIECIIVGEYLESLKGKMAVTGDSEIIQGGTVTYSRHATDIFITHLQKLIKGEAK